MAQNGGAFTSAGLVIKPATGVSPLRMNIEYGIGEPSKGAELQPTTFR